MMNIRKLYISEYKEAIELSLNVFMECGKADFNADGLETFRSFIYNPDLIDELTVIGAFEAGKLVGIVGTKNQGEHISMFFIDPKFHRIGIGRKLFDFAYANQVVKEITVNSSSYAVSFYENLGFSKMADEQETNGLRYTPMMRTSNDLLHRAIDEMDFETVCKMPQDREELFFMFPKAVYPLTVCQLESTINKRWDSTVVLLHGEIAGFANFYELEINEYCSIGNVIVDSQYRNNGVGKYLIETMENIAKEKYNVAEVRLSCFNRNTKGILLYSKLGYKPYEIEKLKDKEGEIHALIKMKKTI